MEVKSCTLFLVLMFATCSLLCQGGGIVYDENGPEVPDTTVPAEVNEPVDVVTVAAPQGEDCGPIQEEISSLRQRVGLLLAALTQHFGDDFQVGEPAGETTQQSPTTEEPEADGECPEIAVCTLEYNPVCGSNGVSYGNPCQFEFAQCKEPSLTSTPGECVTDPDSCGKPCPRDYRPVCGSDGNTYSNQCLFEIELCKNPNLTFEEGECISTPGVEGECPEIAVCTLEYNPVCGSNGVSYGNPCQFEFAQCKEPSLTSTPGECVTDPDSCGKPCPRDYRPVCGSDGNTYSNQCLFEIELCKNPNLTFEEGECISTPGVEDPCAEVECDELPCPEDLQHTYGGNCCPECPQDWGLDPCQLSGTCVVPPTPAVDPCADVECDELPCPEDLQRTYEGNCCPECPQDWGLDPCVLSGTCQVAPTPAVDPASCEKPCPKIYRPVCGSDGNTYSNECLFDIEKCKNPTLTSQEGVCSPSPTVKDPASCERPCTKIYRPVCGSDGNTYSNVCLFDIEKCKNPTLTSQEGVCSPSPTLEDPCADVECVELPCPKDLQYTYESNCCPECPQDWGVDPCVLSGTCGVLPTIDPCADVECFELSCPEDLQHKYEGNCCPECPQDWELDPCEWSGTCRRIGGMLVTQPIEVLPPTSCSDLTTSESGVYEIFPIEGGDPVSVFCDFDTVNGPWTVIQRRIDGSVNFYLTMADYQAGFGNLDGEFWFGLDNIYSMVSQGSYQLRIDLQAGSGLRKFAIYNDFSISDESDGYRLSVGGFSGNARNSLTYHNGMQFSTRDVDNDINTKKSCARFHKGAWWYKKCLRSNLNGRYRDPAKKHPDGLIWAYWRGYTESMTFVEMKIRPTA